ncbi:SMI1/KNR4 family protein [Pantoea allii]|uniref:SMI1/KNR4 family protein n=1 Tax=Pantoea allii TaxID=574096 RepID=A0ABS6VKL7_9GAMM|nr:SMI1/KNR4 family protein [Pantoea allii]MBW1215859.1 SMI1/KNR4 family protein [Pantoea allii]MBW1254570.1 SMI1/KNR4 family protein [Pantoea allii]MBW1259397.1 SMI1/KNR4 family protein [Pantoea allii]MBW1263770.1 SMI1/KNR4 family protein [Pantoea allii]MBW1268557.1 SMI1/KNR4 family protein [Pantoea allii]
MYLSDSEQKLTREEMASFNALFGNRLPQSFQDFYLKNNGGYPLNNEDGNFFMLGGFNSVKYGERPIEELYGDLTESFGDLRKMVPFAYDEGGNSFLLSLKEGDSFGEIFVFLMDEKELVSVADSFDEFIEELFG